ncbi:MFS transporter [Streptobacillus moniliformis]|uniref:Major facilitator superfamily MFS_1 n=1 Tax=Streptobacillus moniliformis (strain ATCC 14647 / DSM 12112 / NCTC 10651 / 9901) TaxID=519441 RepID=D1AV35_STRM9|nr:MFS transporter [Streptobacillus moniliformis]ACZ01595.1 major facilitator superfamily MFS_1 [Streptobacillus moniliformis DSM 12112]AVL43407.1 MFS transporter [Streptobacillus moniliformis]SQA13232.1 drug resistance transporter, Bcr/CflA subfamily [Streptobacillus moniliformis]
MYLNSLFPRNALLDFIFVTFYITKLSITIDKYLYLDTLLFVLITAFEMPSGYISDLFGRKRILILGKVIILISMIVLLFSNNFSHGVVVIVIYSIGGALTSGNTESILFEYFFNSEELNKYKVILANVSSIGLTLGIVLSFLSGIIFKFNILYIIYLDIIIYTINILATIFFLEESKMKSKSEKIEKDNNNENNNKIKEIIDIKVILGLMIGSFIFVFFRSTYNFYQPIYTDFGIDVKYFGMFTVLFSIIGVITNQILKKYFIKKIKYNNLSIMKIYISILFTSFLIMYSKSSFILFMIFICIQQVIRYIEGNIVTIYVNKKIPENTKYRTTYLSIQHFITTGLISMTLIFSSYILKFLSMYTTFFVISLIFTLLVSMLLLILKRMELNSKKIKYN